MPRCPRIVSALLGARPLAALVVAVALFALAPSQTFAHAELDKSTPGTGGQLDAPGQILATFTEAVEPSFSELQVLDVNRKRVDLGDTQGTLGNPKGLTVSVPQLPDGTYLVAWRTLSAVDGHVVRGVFPVVVGAGGLQVPVEDNAVFVPNPGDVLARWLGYGSALALVGGLLFSALVARRPLARLGTPELVALYDARMLRLSVIACVGVIVSAAVGVVFQAANASDISPLEALGAPLFRLLGTRLGILWQARIACALLLVPALWFTRGRVRDSIGLVLGAILLGAFSLNSHAAAVPDAEWLTILADWLHQIAASAWVGGLFAFVLLALTAQRTLEPERRTALLAALVPRFSSLAMVAVAVLTVTGLLQSWIQVKSLPALLTLYGGALMLKVALIVPMLLLGALNLFVAKPGLARAASARGSALATLASTHARRLKVAIMVEAGLGIAVLLATGVLTSSEPARESYARESRPVLLNAMAEDVGVHVSLRPGRPGVNDFVATLDGNVQPPNDVQRVTLRFTNLDDELGSSNLVLQPRDDGTFGAVGSNVTVDGNWQIEVLVRRRGLDDARTAFRTPISTPDVAGQPPALDFIPNPANLSPRQIISLVLMVAGLVLTLWISRTRDVHRRERTGLYAASFAVAMIGGLLYARATVTPALPADARSLKNPFAPDTASVERGRVVYEQNCVSCHGATGRGDGPLAASLRPRPADFRVHMAAGHTDGELFTWLSKGVPGTAMPAFQDQIPEDDRWHVINFIRGFAPTAE
jgi:copper transport protein